MQKELSESRITVVQQGAVVPIVASALHRSPLLATRGLLLEHHALAASEFPKRRPQSHVIYLHTGASVLADIQSETCSGQQWLRPGMVWVMPQAVEHAVRFNGNVEGIGVSFSAKRFTDLTSGAGFRCSDLAQRILSRQPKLEHIMQALWCESLEPTEPGLLAAESLVTTLALVLAKSCEHANRRTQGPSGLSGHQLKIVHTFVTEHISDKLSLQDLSDSVGLSTFHFLRAFKRSTGKTPHDYVLEQRIEKAKLLLRGREESVREVGLLVGFSHGSHFARAFRKHVGATPREFSRQS